MVRSSVRTYLNKYYYDTILGSSTVPSGLTLSDLEKSLMVTQVLHLVNEPRTAKFYC